MSKNIVILSICSMHTSFSHHNFTFSFAFSIITGSPSCTFIISSPNCSSLMYSRSFFSFSWITVYFPASSMGYPSSGSIVTLKAFPDSNCRLMIAASSDCGMSSLIRAPSPCPLTLIADWIGGRLATNENLFIYQIPPHRMLVSLYYQTPVLFCLLFGKKV